MKNIFESQFISPEIRLNVVKSFENFTQDTCKYYFYSQKLIFLSRKDKIKISWWTRHKYSRSLHKLVLLVNQYSSKIRPFNEHISHKT